MFLVRHSHATEVTDASAFLSGGWDKIQINAPLRHINSLPTAFISLFPYLYAGKCMTDSNSLEEVEGSHIVKQIAIKHPY